MRFAPTLGAAEDSRGQRPRSTHVSSRGGETVIKLDIINEVVNKTGITKTKAEMALSELESQSRNQSAFGLQRR